MEVVHKFVSVDVVTADVALHDEVLALLQVVARGTIRRFFGNRDIVATGPAAGPGSDCRKRILQESC